MLNDVTDDMQNMLNLSYSWARPLVASQVLGYHPVDVTGWQFCCLPLLLRRYANGWDGPLESAIDIGAAYGAVGIFAAHLGAKKVRLVEPSTSVRVVHENIRNYKEANPDCTTEFDVVNAAVWHEEGCTDVRIFNIQGDTPKARPDKEHLCFVAQDVPDEYYRLAYHHPAAPTNGEFVRVPVVPFPALFEGFESVDYLKMDVEGSEYNFLELNAATASLLRRVRVLDVEFHHYVPYDLHKASDTYTAKSRIGQVPLEEYRHFAIHTSQSMISILSEFRKEAHNFLSRAGFHRILHIPLQATEPVRSVWARG